MDDLLSRIDKAISQIFGIKNKIAKRDLMKMVHTIDKHINRLDQEMVECRRLKKETIKNQELYKECEDLLSHLEKHITFASLLN